jgi:hypothetical protein
MIYIACPSKHATGGTELLHQLYSELSNLTNNVRIFYFDFDGLDSPVANRFCIYNPQWVTEVIDKNCNILIVPEVKSGIRLLKKYSSINKVVWWLSVDNYLLSNGIGLLKQVYNDNGLVALIKSTLRQVFEFLTAKNKKSLIEFRDNSVVHLYQSEYARLFLVYNGVVNSYSLSDYINNDLIIENINVARENVLLYNPSKGFNFTKKVLKHLKTTKVVPVRGLSLKELKGLYSRSKLYIDFGYHPGKDSIPREAAVNGNLLITNNKGSAKNDIDIPIPINYKIDTSKLSPKKIAIMIEKLISEYDLRIQDFVSYRNRILQEKHNFKNEVHNLFQFVLKAHAEHESSDNV